MPSISLGLEARVHAWRCAPRSMRAPASTCRSRACSRSRRRRQWRICRAEILAWSPRRLLSAAAFPEISPVRIFLFCLYPSGDGSRRAKSLQGGSTHAFIPAAPMRPGFAVTFASSPKRGRRGAGCALHPRSRVLIALKRLHTSIQVKRRTLRHPLRNGVTAYFVLFPVGRARCHRRPAAHCCRPDASLRGVGTTRLDRTRADPFAFETAASIASRAPRVVTMAIRPSDGCETEEI